MPDPSSFMVGNAPGGASYAAPLIGFQAGDRLARLPEEYQAGQLRNAFPNGLPTKNGQVDIQAVGDTLVRLGGASYAQQMLPFLIQQQMSSSIGNTLQGIDRDLSGGTGAPAIAAASAPAASSAAPARTSTPQPVSSSASGPDNITGKFSQQNEASSPSMQIPRSGTLPAGATPIAQNDRSNAPQQPSFSSSPNDSMGAAGVPFSNYPARIQKYDEAIARTHNAGIQAGAAKNPELQKSLEAKAAGYQKIRDQLFEEYQKHLEPTTEQKNIASGAVEEQERLKAEIARGNKSYEGINGAAEQYGRDLKPYLDITRGLMSDPTMQAYTGGGAEFKMAVNRMLNAVGLGDPKALALQETLKKVTAASVLSQINVNRDQMTEAGGSAGRIFKATIDKIDQAVPQLSTSPGGNRALIEIQARLGEQSQRVAEMARSYVTPVAQGGLGHSHLDPGFDTMLAKYLDRHPAFSKEEISNPTLLTRPTAPTTTHDNQQAFFQWAKDMGLKSGELIAVGDGRYKKVPQITVPVRANSGGVTPANAAPQ